MPEYNPNSSDGPKSFNQGKNKRKDRIFLTLEPEKRISRWFLGVASARNTAKTVRQFQDTMLHGDQKHQYCVASLPQEKRNQLAGQIRLEAFIYVGIGLFLGGGSFLAGINSGLSNHVSAALFWLFMGSLAAIIGIWMGTVKFWQSHNVRLAAHVSFLEFMRHQKREEDANGS